MVRFPVTSLRRRHRNGMAETSGAESVALIYLDVPGPTLILLFYTVAAVEEMTRKGVRR